MDFAKRLQKVLDYYGLSATAFSEEIDFNRSTISHLLSGRNKPSLELVLKVLKKFPEVELYWLLNGQGNFPSDRKPNLPPIQKFVKKDLGELDSDFIKPRNHSNDPIIDRIIIFYKDGSFKAYEN